ncbi:MAG: energy transducer TonB [Pseudomonas sp.]|nr:energy transducer TonB [Pseudomonas sp.]
MRWLWSFLAAIAVVFASFVLMLVMIFPPKSKVEEPPLQMGRFTPKLQQDSSDPSRQRQQMPQRPVEPQPETPPAQQAPQPPSTPQVARLDLAVPQLASNISISAASAPSLQGLSAQAVTQSAPPAPAAVSAPAASTSAASSAQSAPNNDAEVIPLNEVLPVYPDNARRRGIEGYVKLAFTITPDGKVENVRVVESSPANVFDREARRAAVRWRFSPRNEGGRSVAREAVKTLQFRLEKRGR